MTLFKVYYVLILITFDKQFIGVTGVGDLTEDNDAVAKKERIDKVVWLQSLDRGDVAKPIIEVEDMKSMSLDALDKLVHATNVELQCSYVYSALLHLHLTKIYVSNIATLLDLTEKVKDTLIFRVESEAMLALVHAIPDEQWNTVRAVMWLFHIFVEKADHFLLMDRRGIQDITTVYRSMTWPYNAISVLLEEFTVTMGCKAYDHERGEPDNLDYVERIRNVVIGGKESARAEVMSSKARFKNQAEKNIEISFNPFKIRHSFFIMNLLVSNALDRVEVVITMKYTFGVQLEWESIGRMLQHYYNQAKNGITAMSVQDHIRALETFQRQFIRVLKAVAMRIVIAYLMHITTMVGNFLQTVREKNKRIADGLRTFVDCVHLKDDQHMKTVIYLMTKPARFTWKKLVSYSKMAIKQIYALLQDMSLPEDGFGIHFNVPMKDDYRQATYAALDFAKSVGISVSGEPENVIIIEIYAEFVKIIADFQVIHWFSQLSTTDEFRRFEELEIEQQRKRRGNQPFVLYS